MKLEKQAVKQIKDRTNKDFIYCKKLLLGQTEENCGYDKTSSWTAKAFNKDKYLKAYISHFVEKKHITRKNIREKLGYGISIYNGQISFDGGVGISSHIAILKNLGFRVDYQSGKAWDAIRITQK